MRCDKRFGSVFQIFVSVRTLLLVCSKCIFILLVYFHCSTSTLDLYQFQDYMIYACRFTDWFLSLLQFSIFQVTFVSMR